MSNAEVIPTKPISRRKRAAFIVAALLCAWLVGEVLACIGLSLFGQGWRRESDVRDQIVQHSGTDKSRRETGEILHPYLGWVRRPDSQFQRGEGTAPSPVVTEFGFADDGPPLTKREPGTRIIAITGGSLAEEFCQFGWPALRGHLQSAPEFRDQRLRIVRLALEGYKQPQQSLLLHYLLSLGAEFDFVVNIDGFNEVALPDVENVPNRVFAAFPRAWHLRAMDSHDRVSLRIIGQVVHLQERDLARTRWFSQRPWRWSPIATLIWLNLHRSSQNDELRLQLDLQAAQLERRVGDVLGPRESFESRDELHRHNAAVWQNSSRLMHDLCVERGIRYLHFLQPNQHLPGSKTLTPEELGLDRGQEKSWIRPVQEGYPFLIQAGTELRAAGVDFHDLTSLFRDEAASTYRDACCHLNSRGNELLARRIAEAILSPAPLRQTEP